MVRVISFVPGLGSGGIGTLMMDWYKRKCEDVEIEIAAIGDGLAYNELKTLGCNIIPFEPIRKVGIIKYTKRAYRIIKDGQYDIVHSHVGLLSSLIFLAAIIAKKKRRILHAHGTRYNTDNGSIKSNIVTPLLKKSCVLLATDYVACSNDAARYLFGARVASNKAIVIHNGIDLNRFCPRRKKASREKVLGYVARFEKNKNQIFLLDVMNELLKNRKDVYLYLIGGGDYTDLEEKAIWMGIREYIKFLPPQKNIEEYYHMMDVFVFPSLNEGLGTVAIEAQACGIPTIASLGVPAEAIVSSIGTRLDLNANLWVEKIEECLNTSESRYSEYELQNSDYNVEISSKMMMKVYLGEQ